MPDVPADGPVRLDRLIALGPLPPAAAVAVVASVADALAARDSSEAHGSLDASSVLVTGGVEGPPGDLAVLLEDPPEGGDGTVADDVLAAGLLLRACLAGSTDRDAPLPPTTGTSPAERNLDRGLRWVLARSTSDDPRKRHRDPSALRADLLTLLPAAAAVPRATPPRPEVLAAAAPPEPAPEPTPTPAPGRRRRRLLPLLLVVLTVLAVAVGAAALAGVLPGQDTTDEAPSGRGDESAAPTGGEGGDGDGDGDGGSGGDGATDEEQTDRVTGDVDGDGLGDVVAAFRVLGGRAELTVQRSTGDGLQQSSAGPVGDVLPLLADTDGDGVTEVLAQAPGADPADLVLTGEDDGWSGTVVGAGTASVPIAGDYDGDGADEAALLGPDGVVRVADLGGPAETTAQPWARNPAWVQATDVVVAADLDGDGDDDLVVVRRALDADEVTLVPLVSDGTRFTRGTPTRPVPGVVLHVFRGADTDGDGVDEVLLVPITGGQPVTTYALDGDTLTAGEDLGVLPGDGDVPTSGVTDVDGDGADDLAVVSLVDDGALLLQVLTVRGSGLRPLGAEVRLGVGPVEPSVRLLDGSVHRPFLPG